MDAEEKETGPGGIERRVRVGIRLKLFGFLLLLVILLIVSVTWAVTEVTQSTLRRDLLQRGASISRVVAFSAGHSMLANDPLGLDTLVSKTKASDPDIAFIAIRDASDIVVAHDRVTEKGKPYLPVPPLELLGTFGDTQAEEVVRYRRPLIEYTTPIYSPISPPDRPVRMGIVSLGLSMEGLATAQRSIRQLIFAAAAAILVAAFFGMLLLSSFITTPVKRLHRGVLSLTGSETFQPVAVRSSDELGALTRNFNRMAETILAQKTDLQNKAIPQNQKVNLQEKALNWRKRTSAWSASSPRRWTRGTRTRWGTPPAWRGCRARLGAASGWARRSFPTWSGRRSSMTSGRSRPPTTSSTRGRACRAPRKSR